MNLYEQIKSHFFLPNAFTDWEHYRDTLTSYLIAQTDNIVLPLSFHSNMKQAELLPTIAILGAGACNDIDLAKLSSHFSKITLIDYNKSAMQQALSTYQLTDSGIIELLPVSLNHITDSDYQFFCEELQLYIRLNQNHFTFEDFEIFALSRIKTIYEKNRQKAIPLAPASYDYIWCFGIHSQLQIMFSYIYHVFEVNLTNMVKARSCPPLTGFSDYLKAENDSFIPRFHDTLLSSAKKAIFLGLEQKRLENNEAVEGACQAITDIRNRPLNITEGVILWPFYPAGSISYEMLIQKITL